MKKFVIQLIGATTLSALQPSPTERALFLGQTGSGKTTLARQLLSRKTYVVVYDGKGLIDWTGYKRVESLDALIKLKPKLYPHIIYAPGVSDMNRSTINEFFKWVYLRRNTCVYVDEVYSCIQHGVPLYYLACITRGRERKIEVWNSVQRPSHVPLNILTESEHYYIFRLLLEEDRRRVSDLTGLDRGVIQKLDKHYFYYCHIGEDAEGIYKLNISK